MNDLEEALKRKADREAARERAAKERELQLLLLEEQLEGELGPRGKAFQIVDVVGEVPIVLKSGPAVLLKTVRASKFDLDDLQRFVTPCVHSPDRAAFAAIIERHAGVLMRCSDALLSLYRGVHEENAGKF